MCVYNGSVGIDLKSAYTNNTGVCADGLVLNAAVRENPMETDGRKKIILIKKHHVHAFI